MGHAPRHEAPLDGVVHVARGDDALARLDDRWDALVERQARPNPTQTAAWLRHQREWEDGEPLVVTVEADGDLLAAGAFGVQRPGGRLGPRVARWLGAPEQWYAPDVLVAADRPEAGDALVRALLREADAASLPVVHDGPFAAALGRVAPRAVRQGSGAVGWVTPLPTARLERVRSDTAYRTRRAARNGVELGVRIARTPGELGPALERHVALHRRRWDGDPTEQPRYSSTERQRDWYRRLVLAMGEHGRARVVEVVANGEPIAAELAFLAGHGAIAHTPACPRGAPLKSPGHIVLLALIDELLASGVTLLDLGLGAGEPGGPKASHGPAEDRQGPVLVGSGPLRHAALVGALALRARLRG